MLFLVATLLLNDPYMVLFYGYNTATKRKLHVLFGYNTATKRVLPVVRATTLLLGWTVVIVLEDSSEVRDRLRVRNLKITRIPSFEIPRLCRILIGAWNLKQK